MSRLIPSRGVSGLFASFPQAHELPNPESRAECHRRAACIMSGATDGQLTPLATDGESVDFHRTLKMT